MRAARMLGGVALAGLLGAVAFAPMPASAELNAFAGYVCEVQLVPASASSTYGTGGSLTVKLTTRPNCRGVHQLRAVCTQAGSTQCIADYLYTPDELHALFAALVEAQDTQMNVRGFYDTRNELVFEYFTFGT
jgi:hypothetical protein